MNGSSDCTRPTRGELAAAGKARTGAGVVSARARVSETVPGFDNVTVTTGGAAVVLYPRAGGWNARDRQKLRAAARKAGVALFVAEANAYGADERAEHDDAGRARADVPLSDCGCTAYLAIGAADGLRAMWANKYVGRVEFPGNRTYFGRTQEARAAGVRHAYNPLTNPHTERVAAEYAPGEPDAGGAPAGTLPTATDAENERADELRRTRAADRARDWCAGFGVPLDVARAAGMLDALTRYAYETCAAHPPAAAELVAFMRAE